MRMTPLLDPNSPKKAKSEPGNSKTKISSGKSSISFVESENEFLAREGIVVIKALDEDTLNNIIWPMHKILHDQNHSALKLVIDSPGGDIGYASKIVTMIRQATKPVIAEVIHAYSAGALIATQCHHRLCHSGATFMLHRAWSVAWGHDKEMEEQMKVTKQANEFVTNLLCERTKITPEMWEEKSKNDWWITPIQAKKLGIVDEIIDDSDYAIPPDYFQEQLKLERRFRSKLGI